MKKNILVIFIFIGILAIFSVIVFRNTRPNYDYVATIYHGELQGADAGYEYRYYIYRSNKKFNEYFYIKSKSNITLDGPSKAKNVKYGTLENEKDLDKITKDIEKDTRKDSQSLVIYTYETPSERYDNIDDFSNKLF